MKTIKVSKGTKDALVDDRDFDRMSKHKWYFDKTQIYAKLSFPTGKKFGHSSAISQKWDCVFIEEHFDSALTVMLSEWRHAATSRSTLRASLSVTIFSKYNI